VTIVSSVMTSSLPSPLTNARRADRRDVVVAFVAMDVRGPAEVRVHGDGVVAVAALTLAPYCG
jgi:hypothetical protein